MQAGGKKAVEFAFDYCRLGRWRYYVRLIEAKYGQGIDEPRFFPLPPPLSLALLFALTIARENRKWLANCE